MTALTAPLKTMAGAWARAVHGLGHPMEYRPRGGASYKIIGGLATVGAADAQAVQALGLGARIVTVVASDIRDGATPQQFDQIRIGAGTFTVDSWQPVFIAGELAGYRGFVKGMAQ